MNLHTQILLTICTGSLIAPLGSAESVAFAPLGGGANAATHGMPQRDDPSGRSQGNGTPGLTFCIRFGDRANATAMPGQAGSGSPAVLDGGFDHPVLSAFEARRVLWSWAYGPVAEVSEDASEQLAGLFMIDGGLDAATLGPGFSAIPDLGDDSRSIGFLQTSDSYAIADGKAGFVIMRSEPPVVVPLPNACALAAAGLLVLGARRRA
ncbi:MAG: hypothetical protein ACFHWZ_09840 [Phycisphaerales bacterium]